MAWANRLAQVYVGRDRDLRQLDAYADAAEGPPLAVLGESGSGKSALLANWALRRQEARPDEIVLSHFVGAGEASTDWVQLLRRIMGELARRCNLARQVPERPSDIVRDFGDWLRLTGGRRVVLVVDGLNQLEDRDHAHDLGWLPATFPDHVRLIVSTLPGRCFDEVRRRGWSTCEVRPLHTGECEQLAVAYLHQFAKTLAREQLERVVYASQAANPLFLRTLLDELRVFGSFEGLKWQLDYYLKASNPEELFDRVLARCEADCERERPGLVRDALRLVWAARRGLAEVELLELLGKPGQPLPRAYWSNLALTIDSALVSRSGLLDFSHDYFRRAVERRYLPKERQKRGAPPTCRLLRAPGIRTTTDSTALGRSVLALAGNVPAAGGRAGLGNARGCPRLVAASRRDWPLPGVHSAFVRSAAGIHGDPAAADRLGGGAGHRRFSLVWATIQARLPPPGRGG